ncbi:MAG: outer membrane protein [Longimicrobiales bacterium]
MKPITIAALALLVATSAQGQKARLAPLPVPQNEGLMLSGLTVVASGITIQGPGMRGQIKTNLGTGAGVQVGYGFTPRIMIFAGADVAKQSTTYAGIDGDFGLAHLELGGRMVFPQPGKRMLPYVVALVGTRALAASSDNQGVSVTLRLSGTELGAGGGFLYALTPSLAIDAGVNAVRGKFGKAVLSGDMSSEATVDVNSTTNLRLKVGFSWHPSARAARS